jgi:hypothetical protein
MSKEIAIERTVELGRIRQGHHGVVGMLVSDCEAVESGRLDRLLEAAKGVGCGVVWCGVVWCGVVWCGVVWCGVVWCGVVWCGVVWRG